MSDQVDGDSFLAFHDDIDGCIEKAGRGRFRAFLLIDEMKAMGLKVVRCPPGVRRRGPGSDQASEPALEETVNQELSGVAQIGR